MTNVLDKFIQNMKSNVPGFIAVSVTEVRSGVSYGSDSVDPSFDPNLASAYRRRCRECISKNKARKIWLIKKKDISLHPEHKKASWPRG